MKEGGGEGRKRVALFSSPPPPRSFTRANLRVVSDSRSSFFASKPNGKLASKAIVTANAQLSSDIYGAVYSLSSTVFTVLFKGGSRSLQCEYRGPRSIYKNFNMTPRFRVKNCKFFTALLSCTSQIKWLESVGIMLEFSYIERGLLSTNATGGRSIVCSQIKSDFIQWFLPHRKTSLQSQK